MLVRPYEATLRFFAGTEPSQPRCSKIFDGFEPPDLQSSELRQSNRADASLKHSNDILSHFDAENVLKKYAFVFMSHIRVSFLHFFLYAPSDCKSCLLYEKPHRTFQINLNGKKACSSGFGHSSWGHKAKLNWEQMDLSVTPSSIIWTFARWRRLAKMGFLNSKE